MAKINRGEAHPEYHEAIRLIHKFFPECKGFIREDNGIDFYAMIDAMELCGLSMDASGDPFMIADRPELDLGLALKGGMAGTHTEVVERLLSHTGFSPQGRVLVIPDTLGKAWPTGQEQIPFVCRVDALGQRVDEIDNLFYCMQEILFVFESGECIAIDHDDRVFWAKSRGR